MSRVRWWEWGRRAGDCFGSFVLTMLVLEASDVSVPDEVRKDARFQIVFDQQACDADIAGWFSCSRPYEGRYNPANNSWTISGWTRSSPEIVTRSDNNAASLPGVISVWGGTGTFDRSGQLTLGGRQVGRIELVDKPFFRLF